jgi:hypothetical protein
MSQSNSATAEAALVAGVFGEQAAAEAAVAKTHWLADALHPRVDPSI